MLETARPIQFHEPMGSGKSGTSLLTCERDDGDRIQVVGKFSDRLERKEASLAMEVIAGCLALDLGLLIPRPYLISIEPDWVESIPDSASKATIEASNFVAFGSTFAGTGFSTWIAGQPMPLAMQGDALATFVFDSFIANPDRGYANPNCLVKGNQIRVIDHELAFFHRGWIGWRHPWHAGSLAYMSVPGNHIFYDGLKGAELDLVPIQRAWEAVDADRLQAYRQAVPQAWNSADAVNDAIELIQGVREHLEESLAEVRRVLS